MGGAALKVRHVPYVCMHRRRSRGKQIAAPPGGQATAAGCSLGVQLLVAGDEGEVGLGGDVGLAAVLLKVLLRRGRTGGRG